MKHILKFLRGAWTVLRVIFGFISLLVVILYALLRRKHWN